jgi:hypothetical protein
MDMVLSPMCQGADSTANGWRFVGLPELFRKFENVKSGERLKAVELAE